MLLHWLIVFVGLVAVARSEVEDCTREKLIECNNPLNDEDLEEIEGIFPKKEFLDKHCGRFLGTLKCRVDFYDGCPDFEGDGTSKLNEPMFDLVTDLCDESSALKKAGAEPSSSSSGSNCLPSESPNVSNDGTWLPNYLENVECYDDNAAQILLCSATSFALIEDFAEHMQNRTDIRTEEMESCVGTPVLMNCIIEEMAQECGSEETSSLAQILRRFSDILLESLCPADMLPIWEQEFSTFLEQEEDKKRRK